MSELHGLIFDIRKFSLHDGPGIRTTVFFKGCPLACLWCHNPESQSMAQEIMLWEARCIRCGTCFKTCALEAIGPDAENRIRTDRDVCIVCGSCISACASDAREVVGKCMNVTEVMGEIERDVIFFEESGGGVTFSGGEPLAQLAFLTELLKGSKALDIHTAVDTSGYTPWKSLDSIRPFTDLFLFDLKLIDETRHRQFTGVPNGLILYNLRALSELGHHIIIRVPIIPGITDDAQNLNRIAEYAAGLPNLDRIDLLPYHESAKGKYERLGKEYTLVEVRQPSEERMQEAVHLMEQYDLSVKIGG